MIINIEIPDEYISRINADFQYVGGKEVTIMVSGTDKGPLMIEKKTGSETDIQYGKRVIGSVLKKFIQSVEYSKSYSDYHLAVSSIQTPSAEVPEGIIS